MADTLGSLMDTLGFGGAKSTITTFSIVVGVTLAIILILNIVSVALQTQLTNLVGKTLDGTKAMNPTPAHALLKDEMKPSKMMEHKKMNPTESRPLKTIQLGPQKPLQEFKTKNESQFNLSRGFSK